MSSIDAPPSSITPHPGSRALGVAFSCLLLLLGVAFAAAWATRELPLFSLLPPGGQVPDIRPEQRLDLHRTFFTIWAALLLVAPALCLFAFRRRSHRASEWWLAFWTAALIAFLVHFYWAVVVIYGNDWSRILHTPRVSAPILDTVFALWWCADVLLAWMLRSEALWVRVQRLGVHALAFILFFMGAAREGELPASRALGWALLIAVALCVAIRWIKIARPRDTAAASPARPAHRATSAHSNSRRRSQDTSKKPR